MGSNVRDSPHLSTCITSVLTQIIKYTLLCITLRHSDKHCSLHNHGDRIKWSKEKLQVRQVSGDSLNYYLCRKLKVDVGLLHTSQDMKFRF